MSGTWAERILDFRRTNRSVERLSKERRGAADFEATNLPVTMDRTCHLTKLERLAGLRRWCDRLVGMAVAYRSGHDPG